MNVRNNKGITLIAEVITVLLLIVIASIILYSSISNLKIKNLNNMFTDITTIQENALNYYLKYKKAPITDEIISNDIIEAMEDELNPNDEEGKYYKINFSLLNKINLNNNQTEEDYYFINEKTLTVYHSTGITIAGLNNSNLSQTFHTLPSNYKDISELNVSIYQD
ncbi:MAG: hypothetical protein IKM97_00640 [Clostridia bacterium]|nr:hypothetical protein [Clostridia bacterium]